MGWWDEYHDQFKQISGAHYQEVEQMEGSRSASALTGKSTREARRMYNTNKCLSNRLCMIPCT